MAGQKQQIFVRRRGQAVKAEVCKTSIRRFESARRLHIAIELEEAPEKSGASSRLTATMGVQHVKHRTWDQMQELSGDNR